VNTDGAVTVDASEVYISAKGTGSTGLKTTSTVGISGDSYVDMDGRLAAIQMIASSTTSEPITLSDGLAVKVGGTLQHVGGGSETIYSYSNKTLDPDLRNASKNVAIAKDSRMIFTEQPKDAVVDYPGGASFEVSVAGGSEDQYTYQWYAMDIVGKEFKLSGTSAKTRKLDIPSTRQEDNRLIYYCVVTCGQDTLASKEAYLDMSNKTQNQTVLYVGNYAVLPGKSIDLDATNPNIGTGTISLDSDGVNITMDNVKINNEKSEYDVLLSPALCIRLDRSQSRDARTDKVYTVVLKGENEIENSFSTSSGNGIPLDFMLRGEEKTGQPPTVIIDGETEGGTLSIKGGTMALRAIANLIINADITVEPYSDTDTFLDAIVADVTDVQHPHKLTVGANHKLRIKSLGSGLSASGALSIGENTEVDVDMTMPHIESSGSTLAQKGAVFAGKDKFEMKPNSKLNISCTLDPELMAEGSECLGLLLGGAALKADKSTININMKAKEPKEGKKSYARAMTGIYSKSYIYMTDSDLSVSVEGDKWATDAAGVNAGTNITMDNCKANIKASANSYVYGLVSSGDFGHYTKLNASQIDIATNYVGGNGLNYGIAGSQMNIDVSKEGSYIKVNSTNANGLAFAAKNGEEGDAPKSYDPSYKAKMITGKFTAVQPQSAVVNVASIHTGSGYEDIETFYDSKNTSKPLASVELAIAQPAPVVTTVTVDSKTVTAASLKKAVEKAGGNPNTVTTIVIGKKVRKISNGSFKSFKKTKTLVVKTTKLKKSTVKRSLKGSKVSKVKVNVGKKKTNRKYVRKYKKIFTKKNAGRKVKVTL
jgi:hypothetical protein